MQIRFSQLCGMIVLTQEGNSVGVVEDVLIHPDKGVVEGFFVALPAFLGVQRKFIVKTDVLHIGTVLEVQSEMALCDIDDIVRLRPLADESRSILGQDIQTESRVRLGRCFDIQVDTESFSLVWLYPRRLGKKGRPISIQDVLSVTKKRICVRDVPRTVQQKTSTFDLEELSSPIHFPRS